ncbi:MAG: acetyl-CoA carboxylase biotin carboxylase subunit, partial [Chloroflexi bacterium]
KTREEAILRMKRVINETRIEGIQTCLVFHRLALEEKDFISGQYSTDFIEKREIVKQARQLARKNKEQR